MITWVLYLCIGVIIGGMAGFYFAKLDDFTKKQKQALEEKLRQSEQELISYKDQVTSHFVETAELINDMTESYQKVHEHLALGSIELCNNAVEVNKLTVSSEQLSKPSSNKTQSANQISDETVTNLANSETVEEAPKNSSRENNNNKSTIKTTDKAAGTETATSTSTTTSASVPEATGQLKEQDSSAPSQPTQPSADNPARDPVLSKIVDEQLATTIDEDEEASREESKTEEDPENIESRVIETMAVAEGDESSDNSDDDSSPKIPGSRMVH